MRQLRMGFGWLFFIRVDSGLIVLTYRLDRIVSTGLYRIVSARLYRILSYRLDRIVSSGLYQETLAFMRWLINVWMRRMGRMDWMGRWWYGCGMD